MKSHPIQFFRDYKIQPRALQQDVLDKVYAGWDKYKYFALNCPTGVGKTYLATAIADAIQNAYILTSTLQLQTQYEKSWDELVNLKGRSNYTCNLNSNFTVDAAPCSANTELFKECRAGSICSYYNQKDLAIQSRAMITNPVYMLYSTHCGFAKEDDSPWVERTALIIDEAHNIENHLVSFAESDVDPQKYHDDFGVATDSIFFNDRPEENYMKVVNIYEILQDKAVEFQEKLEREFPQAALVGLDHKAWAKGFGDKIADKVKKLNTRIYQLDKAIQPLKIFFDTHQTAEELTKRWIVSKYSDKNVLKLAPIYGDFLFHDYLGKLATKFVFLSATLPPKHEFCKELGITEDECLYIETDSPFSAEKSPVIVMPSIKLSKDHYEKNVEKIGGLVDDILEIHKGERGVCHAVTYDLVKNIYQRVKPENRKRLLCRDMDAYASAQVGKNTFPKKYKNSELLSIHEIEGAAYGSVLLSPSMMEGVDLYDDLSRFQIIIKLPWANLGDIRVKIKSELDGDWYKNKMWLNILQASGRSTRNEEDTSVTYILDSNFAYFWDQWKHKLPNWFNRRLVF
jgi:Rad3-related DNA helicase